MSDQDNETTNAADPAPLFTVGDRNYDKDSAVKKIENADSHIATLEAESKAKDDELAQLRAQLDQATKLEDALARLQSTEQDNSSQPTSTTNTEVDLESLSQSLESKLSEKLESSLDQRDRIIRESENEKASMVAAQKVFGEDYETKLREKAKALDMNDKDILDEARKSPAKFKALFGLDRKVEPSVSPNSTMNLANRKPDENLDFGQKFTSRDKRAKSLNNMSAIADKLGVKINL